MTEPRDILTRLTPADRIPSHGQQLTVDGTPGPAAPMRFQPPTFGEPAPSGRPVTLNLWDQSADSLPETWSLDR